MSSAADWDEETAGRLQEFKAAWPQLWAWGSVTPAGKSPLEARCQHVHSRGGQGPHGQEGWQGVEVSSASWDGCGTGFSTLHFIWAGSCWQPCDAPGGSTARNLSQRSFMFQAQLAPSTPVFTQHLLVSKQST